MNPDFEFEFETYKKLDDGPEIFKGENVISFFHGYLVSGLTRKATLYLTNYRLIFWLAKQQTEFEKTMRIRKDHFSLPVTFVSKMEKHQKDTLVFLTFISKDGRKIKIRLNEDLSSEYERIVMILEKCIFIENKENYFAFELFKLYYVLEETFKGWRIYNPEKEFKRQGIEIKPLLEKDQKLNYMYLYKFLDNSEGKYCETYSDLLVIPNNLNLITLAKSIEFRSKNRFPILSYFFTNKNETISCTLWRSSQIKTGLTSSRSSEDETLIKLIGDPTLYENSPEFVISYNKDDQPKIPRKTTVQIFDVRPYLNAFGNKFQGKGYESSSYYKNAMIHFKNLENIHCVKDSFDKLISAFEQSSIPGASESNGYDWFSLIEDSMWLTYISKILEASIEINNSLIKGMNVLVHCSDGWDRTSQVVSISQICIDPYFRTIEGFCVLIEKEWVFPGHQFELRCGHGKCALSKEKKNSPIFIQFLDCVHQLINQYPVSFEFGLSLLQDLAFHLYSCCFGTFLSNTLKEIMVLKLNEKTLSVWSYILARRNKYLNPIYKEDSQRILFPYISKKYLRVWHEYFGYYHPAQNCLDDEILNHISINEMMNSKFNEQKKNANIQEIKNKELCQLNEKLQIEINQLRAEMEDIKMKK